MQNRTISKLLDDVRMLIATNCAESYKQGKKFNVFRIEGIASDEVKMCRFIRELLDPKGSHGQGDIFLKSFLEDVLKVDRHDFTAKDYQYAQVVCEKKISDLRRIDIVISIGASVFPIEVKIYAEDQNKQCQDYYNYAYEIDSNAKIYYLTLDGHEPSDDSKGDLLDSQYMCLSFGNEILGWLDNCIRMQEIEQIYSVREILIQFRDIIRNLTSMYGEKYEMEIKEMIEQSYDNVVAAMQIAKVLPDVKVDKMREVFGAIKQHMELLGYKDCTDGYIEESEIFYKKGRKSWPSINYIIPIEDEMLQGKLVLRFEIEERLYFGICPWSGKDNYSVSKTDEVGKYVEEKLTPKNERVENKSNSWYWWQYLNKENDVNYRYCNSEYVRLFDSEGFANYMETVYSGIDEVLKNIFG